MTECEIWLTAARNAIDELLKSGAAARLPELIELTSIPDKSRSLFEAIDDVLCVQHERKADETARNS